VIDTLSGCFHEFIFENCRECGRETPKQKCYKCGTVVTLFRKGVDLTQTSPEENDDDT